MIGHGWYMRKVPEITIWNWEHSQRVKKKSSIRKENKLLKLWGKNLLQDMKMFINKYIDTGDTGHLGKCRDYILFKKSNKKILKTTTSSSEWHGSFQSLVVCLLPSLF